MSESGLDLGGNGESSHRSGQKDGRVRVTLKTDKSISSLRM